ncbi:MAG: serine hydrolase [Bacteroidota bacterium]
MKKFYLLLCSLICGCYLNAQTGIAVPELIRADTLFQNFIDQWGISGASLAIAKDGKLIYARGFGHSDLQKKKEVEPYHQFRIASISKTITSVAIMILVEEGKLKLSDKVFGPTGILDQPVYQSLGDPRMNNITVQHLLEHSGGWDRLVNGDVAFFYGPAANRYGTGYPVPDSFMFAYGLSQQLDFDPGTGYGYSNLGMNLLGEVIEKITGMEYEAYVRQKIMNPVGAYAVQLGENRREEKSRAEVEYFPPVGDPQFPSVTGDSFLVSAPYGAIDLKSIGPAGGWIASPKELLRYLNAVDGFPTRPDILADTTIANMTRPSANASFYAKGWIVNSFDNWWHDGALPGTSTYMVRLNTGYTYAALTSFQPAPMDTSVYYGGLDRILGNIVSGITNIPSHDLFDWPQNEAEDLLTQNITDESTELSWTAGDGTARIVVLRKEIPVYGLPGDGQAYVPNRTFGQGDSLRPDEFVVFNGAAPRVTVSGLEPGTTYHVEVFEYNRTSKGEPLYQTSRSLTGSFKTRFPVSINEELADRQLQVWPNPAQDHLNIRLEAFAGKEGRATLLSAKGQVVSDLGSSQNGTWSTTLSHLPKGMYVLQVNWEGHRILRKVVH